MFTGGSQQIKDEKEDQSKESEELKKKREGHAIEIRSKNRLQTFNKTRKINNNSNPGVSNSNITTDIPNVNDNQIGNNQTTQQTAINSITNVELRQMIDEWLQQTYHFSEFFDLIKMINTNDIFLMHHGCIGLRKILSVEENPPIQAAIDANLIPKFIEFIKLDGQPHLQLEAAWALTNVASGTTHQTQAIIDQGGIPLFCKLLNSPQKDIAEQAIWALGNIAGDCSNYRDMILQNQGLDPLIRLVDTATNRNTIKHGTWALSNLCRGRPLPDFKLVCNCIPVICKVITHETDSEVLTDACWAISYLSDGDDERIESVIRTGVVNALVRLTDHPYMSVLVPTLRTIGNIVSGDENQTNLVLSSGVLTKLKPLLQHQKRAVRREVCWILSNITAGTNEQISLLINDDEFVQSLFLLIDSDTSEIQREAAWVISNSTNQGYPKDIHRLVEVGVLQVFIKLLGGNDVQTISIILEALYNILNHGKQNFRNQNGDNLFYLQLESLGATSIIENLQQHPNQDIYQKTIRILEEFYPLEDEFA